MREAGQRLTSLIRVSVNQACGLTSFNLQVSMSEAMIAQFTPPSSEPANRAFLRLSAIGRMARSTLLLFEPGLQVIGDGFAACVPLGAALIG